MAVSSDIQILIPDYVKILSSVFTCTLYGSIRHVTMVAIPGTGIILCMRPPNDERCLSLVGQIHKMIPAGTWCPILMLQSHHTAGLFNGCFEQKLYVRSRGPHGPCAASYEFSLPVRGLKSFNVCIISLRAPCRFWDPKQPVNSPCGDRKGPVRAPWGQIRRPAGFLPLLVVSILVL